MEMEVIWLRAITESLDSLINHEVFEIVGKNPHSQILFESSVHQKFFNIILTDFLSGMNEDLSGGKTTPSLSRLSNILASPSFVVPGSINEIIATLNLARDWFAKKVRMDKLWFPSISKEVSLEISRLDALKLCGDMSKHNFARLEQAAKKLTRVFKENSIDLSQDESYIIFEEFYEHFHEDFLNYHASTIAEMLNNIRWGIHEYLLPEFEKSREMDQGEPPRTSYQIPEQISTEFGKACYWELMKGVKFGPPMDLFEVTEFLKMRY